MRFEDFRQWALDTTRQAALRWEDPEADEAQVMLGLDAYGDRHVIPVPPAYLKLERGHVAWLANALPHEVVNRSLQRLAYRTSAWTSRDPRYADNPVDDPKRGEVLWVSIAEKGRFEIWQAPIRRSKSHLPSIGTWDLYATEKDGLSGAVPKRMRMALDKRGGKRGRSMPAANMVISAYDVPTDFLPLSEHCRPPEFASKIATSSYVTLFRPELPGPVIVSQALVFPDGYDLAGHMQSAIQGLNEAGQKELSGPPLGEEACYFEGLLGRDNLYKYTALWRHPTVLCELSVGGPPGRFSAADIYRYAEIQDRRARAELQRRHRSRSEKLS